MHPISLKGWLVLVVCALCPGLTFGVIITGFSFWTGPWIEEFHVTRSNAIVAYTLGGMVLTLFGPVVGRALDRISIRLAVVLGGLTMALGMAVAAVSPNFWVVLAMFATLIPMGACFFGQIPAQTLATRMFPHHTGLVNGVVIAGLSLSGVLIAVVAPGLISAVGWRGAFLTLAAVIALVVSPLAWVMFNDPAGRPLRPEAHADGDAPAAGRANILGNPAFWLILAAMLAMNFGLSAIPPTAVDIAKDAGFGLGAAALFVTVFSVAGAVGSLGGGWLCDHIGLRLVYAGIGLLFLASLAIFALQPGMLWLTLAMGLAGFAGSAAIPWMAANVYRLFGAADFARVVALIGVFYIPTSFYPILVAWIRDETGSYRPAFLLSAAIIALGLTTLLGMRARPRVEAEAAPVG